MRILFIVLVALPLAVAAQKKPAANHASFARFSWQRPADTAEAGAAAVTVSGYTGVVTESAMVTENPATAKKIFGLLRQLQANGTEDINKCFIPRHYIALLHNDSLLTEILVCFECDGIRYGNQQRLTPVKSVAKREALMQQLKALFEAFHFNTRPPAAGVKQ